MPFVECVRCSFGAASSETISWTDSFGSSSAIPELPSTVLTSLPIATDVISDGWEPEVSILAFGATLKVDWYRLWAFPPGVKSKWTRMMINVGRIPWEERQQKSETYPSHQSAGNIGLPPVGQHCRRQRIHRLIYARIRLGPRSDRITLNWSGHQVICTHPCCGINSARLNNKQHGADEGVSSVAMSSPQYW